MLHQAVVWLLVPLTATVTVWGEQNPQAPAPTRLNLLVVEGNEVIKNVKQRTTRDTIVEVQDENHRPVAGAAVVFLLPDSGPGGTFAGGARSVSLVTNAQGRVEMPHMTANQATGQYQIRVTASYRGTQASTTINQQNVAAVAAAHGGLLSGKLIAIIAGIAAAGAVTGAVVATRGGGTPTGSISQAGAATVGGPR